MRFHRFFALLTSVTMLHLTVVAGDAACATHGVDGHRGARAHATTVAAHEMPMHGRVMSAATGAAALAVSDTPAATAATPPCDVPKQ